MHLKYISKNFKNSLFEQMYDEHPEYKKTKKKEYLFNDFLGKKNLKLKNQESVLSQGNFIH